MYINDIDYNEIVQKIVFFNDFFIKIKQYLIIVFWRNMNFVVFQKKMWSFKKCLQIDFHLHVSQQKNY